MTAAARRRAQEHGAQRAAAEEAPAWPQDVSHEPSMKIGEVVELLRTEFPALSISKVRYLESEGLISPHRVGNGYRRYSRADAERLRFTLTAQRDEYLPLSVIRERLEELDAGAARAAAGPVARVVAAGGHVVEDQGLGLADLAHHSGASEQELQEMLDAGLVRADERGLYGAGALRAARLCLEASRRGVPLRNLRAVRVAAEREADTIAQAVQHRRSRSLDDAEDAASGLAGVIADLHAALLHSAVSGTR